MPTFPGPTARVGVMALVTALVFVGVIADRQPTPPRRTPEQVARTALREAREAGQAAVAACVTYALTGAPMRRDTIDACAELLRTGAVPDDMIEVPTYTPDRPGISL